MKTIFLAAAAVQGLLMIFDEFYFHWKRVLPRWERIGHPLDSLSLLLPMGIAAFASRTAPNEIAFISLGILSCVFITKDEWIHHAHSPPSENWVHSLLFVLHPVILFTAYTIWERDHFALQAFSVAIFIFMLYQTIFWNFYADRIFKKR